MGCPAVEEHLPKKRRLHPPQCKPFTWTPAFDIRQPEVKQAWEQDGYIVVKGLLQSDEIQRLESALHADGDKIERYAYGRDDGMGRRTRLCLWNHPGKDVTGMIARVPKVSGLMSELLGGEVYHYHTKLMMKDAQTGGAHLWHQDFGYWSQNGNVFPDMGTVFIPLDKMDAENAGLQVMRGSHKLGLLQHVQTGAQVEADPQRRELALKAGLEHVQLEMEPGDALFFHCLTLHTSGQNLSDRRRWCFLVAFNRADNDPLIEHHHPGYVPLDPADNDAIRDPSTPLLDFEGKDFMNPNDDKSVQKYKEHGFH
jgi:ectoine hydroxylase-related dioxygenase (phytanoyl-CoA dioxygenase family)